MLLNVHKKGKFNRVASCLPQAKAVFSLSLLLCCFKSLENTHHPTPSTGKHLADHAQVQPKLSRAQWDINVIISKSIKAGFGESNNPYFWYLGCMQCQGEILLTGTCHILFIGQFTHFRTLGTHLSFVVIHSPDNHFDKMAKPGEGSSTILNLWWDRELPIQACEDRHQCAQWMRPMESQEGSLCKHCGMWRAQLGTEDLLVLHCARSQFDSCHTTGLIGKTEWSYTAQPSLT